MFTLKDVIDANSSTDLEDTAKIKFALTSLGYYDDTESGLAPYADKKFYTAIRDFQKDNDLKIDGIIKPDGPTQAKIKEKLAKDKRAGNAFTDFKKNFDSMNEARTDDADKYFHCMANYEATSRGWLGGITAKILSDAKELKDQYYEGYDASDIEADQKANRHGRTSATSGKYKSAKEACAIFRPEKLDDKY